MPDRTHIHEMYRKSQAADDAFQAELEQLFGSKAGDMRYDCRKWPKDSALFDLSAAFQIATEDYLTACHRADGEAL